MSGEKKAPAPPVRVSKAEARPKKLRLDKLTLYPKQYCHRADVELTKPRLQPLMDAIVTSGMQVPIEFFVDDKKQNVVIKGHRRVASLRLLAEEKAPGFSDDMEINTIEVVNGTNEDHLLRSIADNLNRKTLTVTERMRAAKVLFDNGIDSQRAAFELGVSLKTHERDLLTAKHEWMLALVEEGGVSSTNAWKLLEGAELAGRVSELREDLLAWVAAKKKLVREKEAMQIAKGGKVLKPAEKLVAKFMHPSLAKHWLNQLKNGKRFDEDVRWAFAAGVEAESGTLHLSSINLDLKNAPLGDLAKVAAKLSKVTQDILPFLKTRSALEAKDGPQARLQKSQGPYDLALLETNDLSSYATSIREELAVDDEPVEEDDEETDSTDTEQE